MQSVKLFETKEIDYETYKALDDAGIIVRDGTGEYTVGYFVYEGHSEWSKFDQWLKNRGAEDHETVLIHHGSFHRFPEYLFPECLL